MLLRTRRFHISIPPRSPNTLRCVAYANGLARCSSLDIRIARETQVVPITNASLATTRFFVSQTIEVLESREIGSGCMAFEGHVHSVRGNQNEGFNRARAMPTTVKKKESSETNTFN